VDVSEFKKLRRDHHAAYDQEDQHEICDANGEREE
jgi:hypothetical protein